MRQIGILCVEFLPHSAYIPQILRGPLIIMKLAQFTGLGKIEIPEGRCRRSRGRRTCCCGSSGSACAGRTCITFAKGGSAIKSSNIRPRSGTNARARWSKWGRPQVKTLKPGDRVAIDPAISCGKCDQCLKGRENTCRNLQFMGGPNRSAGAAAEFAVLPAKNCFPIPDSMSFETAVLVEPLCDRAACGATGRNPRGCRNCHSRRGTDRPKRAALRQSVDARLHDLYDRSLERAVASGREVWGRLDRQGPQRRRCDGNLQQTTNWLGPGFRVFRRPGGHRRQACGCSRRAER